MPHLPPACPCNPALNPFRRNRLNGFVFALLAILSFQVEAQVWNGAGSITNNNFSNTNNWVPGTAPAGNSINGLPVAFGALASGATNTANCDATGNSQTWTFNAAATNMVVTMNSQQMGAATGPDVFLNSSPNLQTINGSFLLFDIGGTTTSRRFNASTGPLTLSGGTISLRGDAAPSSWAIELSGSDYGTLNDNFANISANTVNYLKTGTGTWEAKLALGNLTGNASTLTVNAGTLQLDADCSFSGNTTVSGGTLILNAPGGASGALASGTTLTISSGATVQENVSDGLGYSSVLSGITINGGTLTTLGGSNFRVTLAPTLTFTGGTLTGGAGNAGDGYGNYLLKNGGTAIAVNATSSAVLINPPAGVSIFAGTTFSVARGTAASDLVVSCPILNWNGQVGSLSLLGGGITVFSGTNSYTGTTTVSAGKLLQAAATTGGGAYSVADGATLGVQVRTAGNTLGLSALTLGSSTGATNEFDLIAPSTSVAAITVTNALTVAGASKINIVTAPLIAGNYPLIAYGSQAGAGTLTLGTVPGRSSLTLSNDATHKIYYLVVGASDLALTWTGTNSVNWDTASINWTNAANLPTNYVDNSAVTFNDNSTSNAITIGGTVSPGSVAVNTSVKSYTFAGAGKISGITGLTKSGTTTLTLNTTGVNDFSGPVAVNGGIIALNNASQITAASSISVASGGTLQLSFGGTGTAYSYAALPVSINGNGASGTGGALTFIGGNNWTATYPGPITLAGNAQIEAYGGASVASPDVLNLAGPITGNYNLTFWGQGASTAHWQQINLSSAGNAWGGSTTLGNLAAGTIVRLVGGNNRLPTTTTVNLNATWFSGACTAELDLDGNNQTLVGLNGNANDGSANGNNIVQNSGNGTVNFANLTISGTNGTDSTFNGTLGAAGANNFNLVKSGLNNFTLGGANTFDGSVSVNAGTLQLNNANALQHASGVTVASGAALRPNVTAAYASTPVTITGSGTGGNSQGALDFHSGGATTHTWPGTVTLNGAASVGSYGVTMRTTLSGPIVGTGTLTIQGQGGSAASHTAAFLLGVNNTYSGSTTFNENGGLLWFAVTNGVANALPPATALTLQSGNTVSLYDLNGFNQTLSGLMASTSGSGTARLQNSSGTAAILTINNAASDSYSGFLGGTSANNLSLVKGGAGTLTLSGANSYTGTTTITNGALSVGADNNLGGAPGSFTQASILLNAATLQGNASFTLNAFRGITLGPTSQAGSGTIDVTAGNIMFYGGVITNGGTGIPSLTKVDTGTFALTGPNAFGGNLFINAGSLALSGSGSLSNAPGIYVNTNGTFDVSALATPYSLTGSQSLAGFGTVTGAVTIVAGTTLQPGTNLLAGTISFSNLLALNSATLNFAFSTNTTAGGGINSLIQMNGGTLTLNGTTMIQPQLLNGILANGTYTLIQGASSIVGGPSNLHLNLATRQTITFNTTAVPGTVQMIVGGAVPASIVWAGTNGNAWDTVATINWLNNGTPDYFYSLDNVTFNDSAANGSVTLAGAQSPGSVVFSNSATTYTLTGGSIAGAAGGVTLNGPGTVNLNNTNSYSGPTIINAGTLNAGAVNTLPASSSLTISNGTLNAQTYNQSVGSVTLVNGNLSGSGAMIVAPSFLVQTGSVSAALGGAATLTKTSSGTVTLTGANTNAGATTVTGGTLTAGAANALSAHSAVTVSNATLNIQGNNQSVGALTLVNGNISGSGGALTAPSFLVQTGAVTAILAGGSASLTKSTAGTVILDANNTFGGGTVLSAGTLQVGNSDTAGTLGAGSVNVTNSGTTITFNRTDSLTVTNTIQDISAGGSLGGGGTPNLVFNSGTVTLGGSGDNNSAIATVNNGGTLILGKTSSSSVHALGSGLTLNAGGLLQLGGSGGDQIFNSVAATMNGGTFDLAGQNETIGSFVGYGFITNSGAAATVTAGGGAGGNSAGAVFASGGTLSLQGGTVTVGGTWNNQFGVAGGATFDQAGGTFNAGSYFAVGNGSGSGSAFMTARGGTLNCASELLIGFQRPATFTITSPALLNLNWFSWGDGTVFNTTNWFDGGTIILQKFNNRGSSPAFLYFNGSLFQANSGQNPFLAAAPNVNALVTTNGALLDSSNFSITITAPLLHDPALGGLADGGLTKFGTGTLVLSGTNTYSGPTSVGKGTLQVSGALGTGDVSVATNAALAGNGLLNGATTVQPGGTLQPGLGGLDTSTLTISNNVILSGAALLTLDRTNAQNAASVAGINTMTYGGSLILTNVGPGLQAGDSFTLFRAGSYVGNFASIIPATPGPGLAWDTTLLATSGTIFVGMIPTNNVTPSPAIITYGNNLTLTASAGGTPPLAYQWYSNSVPIVGESGSTLTLTAPTVAASGNYAVTVTNVYGSVSNQVAVTINPLAVTVTATALTNVYGAPDPALTFSYAPSLVGTDSFGGALSRAPGESVGSYSIGLNTLGLNANYSLMYVGANLVITPALLSITANSTNKSYGQTLTFAGTEFTTLGLTNSDGVSSVTMTSTGAVSSASAGNYAIVPSAALGSGLGNYNITYNSGNLTVTPVGLLVSANNTNRIYGAANPVFTATISGFVNGDSVTNSDVVGAPDLETSADTNSPAGSYVITNLVGSLASTNYVFSLTNGTLTVAPAAITVTADNQSRPYGAANPALTYSYSGFVNGDDATVITGTPALSVAADTNSPVNSYPITVDASGLSATNYIFTAVNGTLSVTAADLTITASDTNKVYGQTLSFAGTEFTASGLVNGETIGSVTLTASGGTAATDAATTYSIMPSAATGGTFNAGNYNLSYNNGTLTVTPLGVTVTADPQTKVYGTTEPTLTYTYNPPLVGSDSFGGALSRDPGANVGSYNINQGTLALSSNYILSYVGNMLTITVAPLSITANSPSKVYGQTLNFAGTEFTSIGLVPGDSITSVLLTSDGATNTAPVAGSPYAITIGSAGGIGLGNYNITYNPGTLTVTPANLGVTADNTNRIYAAANPVFTATISGFVNGESVTNSDVVGAPDLETSADTNSPAGSYVITNLVGSLASTNYVFSLTNGTLTVAPAAITVTVDNQSRPYGAANPALTYSYSGFVNGDDATVITGTPALSVAADTNSPVNSYPITVDASGLSATNYIFTAVNGTLSVTAADLTITASDTNKVYGQTLSFAGTEFTASGLVNGETIGSVTLIASGGTAATDAATTYSITPSAATGGTFDAGNYNLSYNNGTLTVTPLGVTVTADPQTKVYGSADPSLTYSFTPALVTGDSFSGGLNRAPGENVGSYAIGQGSLSLSANYTLTYAGANLSITAAPLSITANSPSKVYGQTVTFAGTEFTSIGLVPGDSITSVLLTSDGATNTAGVAGSPYPIVVSAAAGSGLGNYNITYNSGSLSVTPANLGVTADNTNRIYGAANPVFTVSYSGFVNGEGVTNTDVVGAPDLETSADTNSPAGSYVITNLVGSLASTNYVFSLTNGTLTVAPAAITVTADDQSRPYGAANPELTYSYSGFVNGDDATVITGTPALSVAADTNSPVNSYPITVDASGLSATNYIFTAVNGTLSVTAADLTITASDTNKVYGQTLSFAGTEFTASGLVNGETIGSVTLTASGGTAATDAATTYSIMPSAATGGTFNAGNYNLSYNNGTLTVTPLGVTVTADPQTKVYGSADPSLTYSFTPALVTGDSFSGGLSRATGENVGSYAIGQGSLSLSANYALTYAGADLSITAATLTYVANAVSMNYGGTVPSLTGTVSGFVAGDNLATATTGMLIFTTTATSASPVGTYPITGSGLTANNGNYTFVQDPGNSTAFTVNCAAATSVAGPNQMVPTTNTSVGLVGTVGGAASGGTWSTSGTGTFNPNATTLDASYVPSPTDIASRQVTLTLTSTGANQCSPVTSMLTVTFNTAPVAPAITIGALSGVPATSQIIGGKHSPTDVDNDPLIVSSVQNPSAQNGVVTTDGTNITYTALNTFSGADTFSYVVSDNWGGSATNLITVNVINGAQTGFNQLAPPALIGGGQVLLSYLGIPDNSYLLETSTNLAGPVVWLPLQTNTAAANGVLDFTNSTSLPQSYYRTRLAP